MKRPKIKRNKIIEDKWIKLSTNEPAFGVYKKYPYTWPLYQKLANYYNIDENQILLTAGSEQGIRFVFDEFVDIGSNILRPEPTFGMLEVFEYYRKANVYKIEYENFKLDIDEILHHLWSSNIKLFYIANPDNPTGSKLNLKMLSFLMKEAEKANTMMLLDEAYYHYNAELETTKLINKFQNLIIVRSFSKAFGLAGERVGYILSNKDNIERLILQRPVNEITQHGTDLAIKALKSNILYKNINQTKKWQSIFRNSKFFNFTYIETYCNFIILESSDAIRIKNLFDNNQIAIRLLSDKFIRITVGTDKEMNKVLKLIGRIK